MIANKKTRKGKGSLCGFLLKFSVIYDMMKKREEEDGACFAVIVVSHWRKATFFALSAARK